MTFIALLLSLSTHVTVALLASLASFLAALLTLIAFAIDIALYVFVKHQMAKLVGVVEHTDTAPGASFSPVARRRPTDTRAHSVLDDVRVVHPPLPRGLHRLLRPPARPHGGRDELPDGVEQAVVARPLPPVIAY